MAASYKIRLIQAFWNHGALIDGLDCFGQISPNRSKPPRNFLPVLSVTAHPARAIRVNKACLCVSGGQGMALENSVKCREASCTRGLHLWLCGSSAPQGPAYNHLVGPLHHIPLFVGLLEFAHNGALPLTHYNTPYIAKTTMPIPPSAPFPTAGLDNLCFSAPSQLPPSSLLAWLLCRLGMDIYYSSHYVLINSWHTKSHPKSQKKSTKAEDTHQNTTTHPRLEPICESSFRATEEKKKQQNSLVSEKNESERWHISRTDCSPRVRDMQSGRV